MTKKPTATPVDLRVDLRTASLAQAWEQIEEAFDTWALAVKYQGRNAIQDAKDALDATVKEYTSGDRKRISSIDVLLAQKRDELFS